MPIQLRDYQQDAVQAVLTAKQQGLQRVVVVLPTGSGKSQPVDEPVLTPYGWKPIGTLTVGDKVIGSLGVPIRVLGVYPQGVLPCWRIRLRDGSTTRCSDDHLWTVDDLSVAAISSTTSTLRDIRSKGLFLEDGSPRFAIPILGCSAGEWQYLTAIEACGEADMVCIAVDAPDSLYVTHDYILTHNTIVFAELIKQMGVRTLVLAHRDELIEQAVRKIAWVINGDEQNTSGIGVVKAERNEVDNPIVCASVQTVQRPERCLTLGSFGLIITDETQHSSALSYRNIYSWLKANDPGGPFMVGVTATPDRTDKVGLSTVFQKIVYTLGMEELIDRGVLSDLRAIQVNLDLDLNDVEQRHGDFAPESLDKKMFYANAPLHAFKAWKEHAYGLKTLAYWPSVEMAKAAAEYWTQQGISSAYVHYKTDSANRRNILKRFTSGDICVTHNYALLLEGYDEPSIECILMGRPTKSRSAYQQAVGRGARKFPGKECCLILDLVDVTTRHKLITTASLFGLPIKDVEEKGVQEAKREALAREMEDVQDLEAEQISRRIELFQKERLIWTKDGKHYRLHIPDGVIRLTPDTATTYAVIRKIQDKPEEILGEHLDIGYAQGVAEDAVRAIGGKVRSSSTDAPWKVQPPSAAQYALLRSLSLPIPPGISAGDAVLLLSKHFARKK